QVYARGGAREALQPQSSGGADRGTGEALPGQQLIWFVAVYFRIPFDRGSIRAGGGPTRDVITRPANFPQMRHELREIVIVAQELENLLRRCTDRDGLLDVNAAPRVDA